MFTRLLASRRAWASVALALLFAGQTCADKLTPLDKYVAAPDPNYRFALVRTTPGEGYTAYLLEMTSQAWRSAKEVDRPVWQHWLTVIKPEQVRSSTALLFITGGSNNGKPPGSADRNLAALAVDTSSVAAELRMVPNQPLTFIGDDSKPRSEDSLIAYTWDKYLKTGDATWPARLPMTKSAVRAMDTVTAFCAGAEGGNVKVDRFVVSGGSKRGWTAWTTAAVDRRVVAVVPIVIDVLNMKKSMEHHYQAYGFWAPAIKDYEQMGLMEHMDSPRFRELAKIVEPYEYRDRLTMPKFIMNSSGDQFFLPDSSQFYFDDLPGEKHLRYVPNADHSLRNSDAWQSLHTFYQSVVKGAARPRFSWKFGRDGTIRVQASDEPSEVKLWQATNPKARDFRLETLGPKWTSTALTPKEAGVFVAAVPQPPEGWTAFFVELTFPSGAKYPWKLTSGVRVVPDRLPFSLPKTKTASR